ncbi:uncharacterized protein LOC125944534 [Dermacentor silvarum]|uniref:uncharacterized protein LOC125944534 n=1 Tax=Dermacentor silvarum TaxID=543639 RepID=UPI002101A4CB|nr:uncharacterized protein LOC125944534 [Dermacentor silvarum]
MNDASLLQETACSDSGTVEQMIRCMETGSAVEEEEDVSIDGCVNVAGTTGLQSLESCSHTEERLLPSPLQSQDTCEARSTTAATPKPSSKKQTQQAVVLQLVDEQRQQRYSWDRSKERELQLRKRQIELDEAAGEREERLIAVLEKLAEK